MFQPKLPSFSKLPKHQTFDYQPIYNSVDQEKGHRKELEHHKRIKQGFRVREKQKGVVALSYRLRIIIIAILLSFFAYYFLL